MGSKAYYELEILDFTSLWCGFASAAFIPPLVPTDTVVGEDAESWAVTNNGEVTMNNGKGKIKMLGWKQGDVIGLACDLQAMQMLSSVNGSFAPPKGRIFDLAPDSVLSGLFATFSCGQGAFGYNLGEAPFKYDPPAVDYCAFVKFALIQEDLCS